MHLCQPGPSLLALCIQCHLAETGPAGTAAEDITAAGNEGPEAGTNAQCDQGA